MNSTTILALDVGTRRIGLARGDTGTKLAFPIGTLDVDEQVLEQLGRIIREVEPMLLVVGYPRNQAGEPTAQTDSVVAFTERLRSVWNGQLVFQDESLTSVMAEHRLQQRAKPYEKAEIDAEAAAIILQDYLEAYHGH